MKLILHTINYYYNSVKLLYYRDLNFLLQSKSILISLRSFYVFLNFKNSVYRFTLSYIAKTKYLLFQKTFKTVTVFGFT